MAEFSMIQLWDDTRRFVVRELALLLPLGFATFGLATLIVSLVAPQHRDAAATSFEPWMLWMIPAAGLMLIGYLATSRIVLQPGISVAEAIDGAVRLLPRAILERPKVGFRVPVSDWFRGPMRDYLHDHLCGPDARTRDWYRPQALHRVLSEHVEGRQNHEKLLWTMLTLELWHREYL